jgi:hypothetical protein
MPFILLAISLRFGFFTMPVSTGQARFTASQLLSCQ